MIDMNKPKKEWTEEEIQEYMRSKTATVGKLIEHLKQFDPNARLCFWHEGGAYMNCEHLPASDLGDLMFKLVKDDKERRMKQFNETKKHVDDDFGDWISDDDVLIY